MGSSAIAFALIAVGIFLLGFCWAIGRAALERKSSSIRLWPTSAKSQGCAKQAQAEKYTQMKADLDTAFKSAAADALRANTESFLALAKQELGGQTREAKQTLEAKELAIKNLLDPLGAALKSLDEQTRAMETARVGRLFQSRDAGREYAAIDSRVARCAEERNLRN